MKNRLLEGPLFSAVLSFSIPLVLGMVGHALFNLVDVRIVGELGPDAVVAAHVASVVNFIPMILFNGVGVATVSFLSRYIGQGNHEAAERFARQSLCLTFVAGVVLSLLGYFFSVPIIHWLRTPTSAIPATTDFLEILSLGTISMFLLLQVSAILRAAGDSVWPMILLLGGNVLNLLLCFILIFGWGPIPRLEVKGAAYATVISRALFGLLGCAVIWRRGLLGRKVPLWEFAQWKTWWALLRLGVPNGLQIFTRVIAVLGITSVVQYMDNIIGSSDATAAFGVGVRFDMLALFGAAGWGAAASTVVGLNLGANQPDRAVKGVWIIVALASIMLIVVGIGYYFCSQIIYRGFIDHPSQRLLSIGSDYLRIMVFAYLPTAICVTLAGALNGAGNTKLPLLLDAIAFCLVLYPVSTWIVDDHGLNGIWWLVVGVNATLALVYIFCFQHGGWKTRPL